MKLNQWVHLVGLLIDAQFKSKYALPEDFQGRYHQLRSICINVFIKLGIDVRVEGVENIPSDQAVYFVSNHQGTFDPLILITANPIPMTFISKVENLKLPVIKTWGNLIGFITFDRESFDENVSMLRQTIRFLKDGKNVLIFPEGTRSKGQTLLPFKEGALLPAYMAKVPIVCITQNYGYECDRFNKIKHPLEVIFHPPITYEDYQSLSHKETMDLCVSSIQSKLK